MTERLEQVRDADHQYVGRRFTYLPGIPTLRHQPRDSNLVLRAGDEVRVVAVFRHWNNVEGLDMLYVRNMSSTNDITHTHVTPADLGIPAVKRGDHWDFFTDRPRGVEDGDL